ncbi:autotransporter domain-containing protein, partial [Acinetobacter baumannii]
SIPIMAAAFAPVIDARAVWLHEFGDTSQQLTASFLAGSPSFAAAGPQDSRDTLDLGLGLRVASGTDGQSGLAVSYDAAVRD